MEISSDQRRLLALCAIRIQDKSVDWSLIARLAFFAEGLDALWQGDVRETSPAGAASRPILRRGLASPNELFGRVDSELAAADSVGAHLTTVLDSDYPANLRLIPNLPPFLFVRGDVGLADALSVAVVGTREASPEGVRRARNMATLLAVRDVTVVSGLARGIDTTAHRAALDAGGRTIAVLGTGITNCYPAENAQLAEEIAASGALVSQFWPTRPPGRDTFPRRNVVTSGISQGTVVIEASNTSGAKMQARLALEHGKKVFIVRSLVTDQRWAQTYVAKRGAIEVGDVDEVIRHLAEPARVAKASEQRQQLAPTLF
jgi:DNA processing protein